jgi:hypothetical protein
MKYFVGSGDFDTHWHLPEDMPPEEGDVVFLIRWSGSNPVLIGLFTVGVTEDHVTSPAMPPIKPDFTGRIPSVRVPPHLLPEPPQDRSGAEDEIAVLHLLPNKVGSELRKIAEPHLPFGRRRERREKAEKSPEQKLPEQWLQDVAKEAENRLGQKKFRDLLMDAYGGRCAITECEVPEVLSAAHIWDYSLSKCQEAWNGILLRADIHLLFDRQLLRIFPGNPPVVVLDPCIQKVEPYKNLHLLRMRPPEPFDQQTNEHLRRRWDAANRIPAFGHFPDPSGGRYLFSSTVGVIPVDLPSAAASG